MMILLILLDMIQLVLPRDPLGSAKAPRSAWRNRRCHWLLPGRWYAPSPPVDIRSPKDERTQKSMVRLEDDGCAVKMFSNQGVLGPKDTSFLDKFSFRPIYWGTVSAEKVDLYIYNYIYISIDPSRRLYQSSYNLHYRHTLRTHFGIELSPKCVLSAS